MEAAVRNTRADPELRPASPKRRRLSHSPGTLPLPVRARLAASSPPWVDDFDDCDSLFPPLAPVPGVPRYRNLAAPTVGQQAGASGSSPVERTSPAGLHAPNAASGQARHQAHTRFAINYDYQFSLRDSPLAAWLHCSRLLP